MNACGFVDGQRPAGLRRVAPGLLLTAALLALGSGAGCGDAALRRARKAFAAPQHVVLVTLDTFRADRLAAYGGDAALTPNLNRIASQGLVFTRVYATNPITLPSHCSIMTGQWPFHHGVRENATERLPDTAKTLAEYFQEAGYATAGFVSGFPVTRNFGIEQGFAHFDDHMDSRPSRSPLDVERRGDQTLAAFEKHWAGRPADTRTFDWLHLYDAHFPYEAPAEWHSGRTPYDAEVAWVDSLMGQLEAFLRKQPGRTLVVITADHGEGLGDHGEDAHGFLIYDPMVLVPLILWSPQDAVKGVDGATASLVDLAPTLLAAAGMAATDMDGHDLLAAPAPRPLYMEAMTPFLKYGVAPVSGAVEDGWKVIAGPLPELYDLGKDAGEANNLYYREPERAQALEARRAAFGGATPGAGDNALSEEETEALLSLGYVGGALPSLPDNPTMDVKDFIPLFKLMELAAIDLNAGRKEEACAKLEQVAAALPDVPTVRYQYGRALTASGRMQEALREFNRAIELGDPGQSVLLGRGTAYGALGMTAEAIQDFRKVLEMNPDNPSALSSLGVALETAGDVAGAKEAYLHCLRFTRSDSEYERIAKRLEILGVPIPADQRRRAE